MKLLKNIKNIVQHVIKMRLLQSQNPNIVLPIINWWRKYLSKVSGGFDEAELAILANAFSPTGETKFFVLIDEEKKIHGFATVAMDHAYGAMCVKQVATDNPHEMKKELLSLADKAGATEVYFATERNPRAWKRLLGAKLIGYLMKIEED